MAEDRKDKDHPAEQATQKCDDDVNSDFAATDLQPIVKPLRTFIAEVVGFGCAATGLWVLGEHLENHGFKFGGACINVIA